MYIHVQYSVHVKATHMCTLYIVHMIYLQLRELWFNDLFVHVHVPLATYIPQPFGVMLVQCDSD